MMEDTAYRAIAIVGAGAVLPDAPDVAAFWDNVKGGRYSITEVNPDRWDPALYYDPDPRAPDKTYSKIGGWVRDAAWDPMKWRLAIPPRVADAMDDSHKWAIACTREALEDYGYPARPLDRDRTAVILGNAMAGEKHYMTALRAYVPEYARELDRTGAFASLPAAVRDEITRELRERIRRRFPEITEDSMPGELANCIAGRIANVYNLHGPNYVTDAACASAMAAVTAAVEGLVEHAFDLAITGGIDRNMGVSSFIKFCKIGALSATGSRPYADGADGFVMGEGGAVLLLKRLADAVRDGDKIYAVLRGIAGSSDGKGKGITAPNPVGQKLAIRRAWENAGLSPATCGLMEGHGTSTRVGDLVETESLAEVLDSFQARPGTVALGSVKSNIGHLKGAAGAAGLLKATLALRDKVLPPSVNCERPNPAMDFSKLPIYVNTELRPWTVPSDCTRRVGVSAFGFGGTNFHAVLEEYVPGRLNGNGKRTAVAGVTVPAAQEAAKGDGAPTAHASETAAAKPPLRGALVIGAQSEAALVERLHAIYKAAQAGTTPAPAAPAEADLRAPERLAIDYGDAAELSDKCAKALKAFSANQVAMWKALRPQGVFRGSGTAGKVAFLYTGQGSQYVNMLAPLRAAEPLVAETFAEADRIMTPLLGRPLSDFIFVDSADEAAIAKAEDDLRQTALTQPAVLATDLALTRLLAAYGIRPDMTMGHSLGEYGALVAAGALPFADALEAVSARGRGMTQVSMADNGKMAAVFAPLEEIERTLKSIDGYVVVANINSNRQAVIGGASAAVDQAVETFLKAGYNAVPLTVSHAFHTSIVAGAGAPLRQVLERLHMEPPRVPVVTNVTGEFYPSGPGAVPQMVDILTRQVASPVQFIKGLRTLHEAGARVFVEVGPKKALHGFVEDVLGESADVLALFTNHPKNGDLVSFNQALCGLYAAGLGSGAKAVEAVPAVVQKPAAQVAQASTAPLVRKGSRALPEERYTEMGRLFAEFLERGREIWEGGGGGPPAANTERIVISGAALGLPGTERIFDDANIARILHGQQFIKPIPDRIRRAILDKHITRLVKSENGGPTFEAIENPEDVIRLAARGGSFDLEQEFGVPGDRVSAFDRTTRLAIAAGMDALRDAGIPLVMHYKKTTRGTQLPERWGLPEGVRDETGVIFASCFPGYDSFTQELSRYYTDRGRREQLAALEQLRKAVNGNPALGAELDRRMGELRAALASEPYTFDRRFILRTLPMGHSQFAEFIGARGPNTQLNAACASTTQAVGVAEDWIRTGRCRRVVIVSADDVTSENLLEWMGAGFLATGAAATDEVVEDAAVPFDRRRHGMLLGMGAASLVVESAGAAAERGIRPICEVLSTAVANSAFHATRLDLRHISGVMEGLVSRAEARSGVPRQELARSMVFVSHETYTPARGGSASAEINALRAVFGDGADSIVIANTKGFTGHAMGAGVEDVVAVKALETGFVPPVANYKEPDPELGPLNLSKGGSYPVEYALRLGAGFGSQINMTLIRRIASANGARQKPDALGYAYRIADETAWRSWLERIAGDANPEVEVARRVLRVKDRGARTAEPARESIPEAAKPPAPAPKAATPSGAAAAPALAPQPESDPVKKQILELVAAKTGYGIDMIDPALDLEADLGIDTVKQAEIFAAVREAYGIPRDDKIRLRDFPSLAHVIQFVRQRRPDLAAPEAAPTARVEMLETAPPPETTPPPAAVDAVQEKVLDLVAAKTGYAREMLALDLDLEADLGIDTVKQAEVLAAVREAYNIPRDESRKLRDFPTLAHVIGFVREKRPDLAGVAAAAPAIAAEPVAAPPAPPAAAAPSESIRAKLLEIVAAKTGYPKEMLDVDLDLEADLGVDTVKQAEVLAAVREAYSIPRDDSRKLRDFPTLAHVIRFVAEKRPDLAGETLAPPPAPAAATATLSPAVPAEAPTPPAPSGDAVREKVLEIVADKTGYPKEMLDLELDLEADLGVDTVKQAEVLVAVREAYGIARDDSRKLRDYPTLAHVIRFVHEKRPDLAGEAAQETVAVADAAPVVAPEPAQADSLVEKVLEIAAGKTGYPKEMLDLDLDLEADLGIDTVKQAEMFASVREAFQIPRDVNLKLRDFPTLRHVIQFARDRQPAGSAAPSKRGPAKETQAAAPVVKRPEPASMDAANALPRRVPVPALRPALAACKTTGVTLGAGGRVIVMPDEGGVADALAEQLRSAGVEVLTIDRTLDSDALGETVRGWLAVGPVQGIYWLPALDHEGDLLQLDTAGWRDALRVRVKMLYAAMRTLYEHVAAHGTFLVSAARLGGQHGYDEAGAVAPLGGAVTGFAKTYKRERPEALVKAVDFEAGCGAAEIAATLIGETLRGPGAVEIGYSNGQRWTVALQEQPAADGQPGLTLDKDTVFLVTGAAGSIVSAITADLATASGGTFYLLDLVEEPDPNNPDLKRFVTDKDGLKRELFARMQARGERATPALVEKQLAALERAQAAQSAIDAVRAAGGTARYFSVNLTDGAAVAEIVRRVREESGRIDVLLHAAGMERSHFLPDKDPREFDLVFDVKADGWFNLLHAIGDMPLGATVVFSSIAGRFGNAGQTDYSSANDLLCKITSSFRTTRTATRGIAVDWTAWAGIGMAARGSIPKMMEMAGIDMLPPEAGIPLIRRELTAGGMRGEVVAAQRLGILLNEWDPAGGLDEEAAGGFAGPMVGQLKGMGLQDGLTVETVLDPAVQPFLNHHRIDGTPVLPGVMGVEAFAEAALSVLPGWHIEAVEDVNFLAPFKFYRDEPRTAIVRAVFHPQGEGVVAECRLIGTRKLPNGTEQETTHFTGRVRLSKQPAEAAKGPAFENFAGASIEAADIYGIYFHGPAYQVVERAWRENGRMLGKFASSLPDNHYPPERRLAMAPRLIELCFQTAGLWEMCDQGRMGLPQQLASVRLWRAPELPEAPLYAMVTARREDGSFTAEVIDEAGNRYLDLTGYRTVELPEAVDVERLKALRAAAA